MNPPSNETIARYYPGIAAAAPFLRKGQYEKTLDIDLELLIAGFERVLEATNSRNEGR
jgi:hypothetical protein